jgi:hypothetical protein
MKNKNNIKQEASRTLALHVGFLFRLFLDPEDDGDMFLRNVRWFSTDYKAL